MSGTDFLKESLKISAITGALFLLLCELSPNSLFYNSTEETSMLSRMLSPFLGAIFSVACTLIFGGFYAVILFILFGIVSVVGGLAMLLENIFSGIVAIVLGGILLIGARQFVIALLERLKTLFPTQSPRYVVVLATFPILSTFYFWHLVRAKAA